MRFNSTLATVPTSTIRTAFLHHAAPFASPSSVFARGVRITPTRSPLAWRTANRGYACVASSSLSASLDSGVLSDEAEAATGVPLAPDVGFDEAGVHDLALDPVATPALSFDDDLPSLITDVPKEKTVARGKPKIENGMGPPVESFRISAPTVERLAKNGITRTTEVQACTFDLLYDGKDIIAKSRTGTGKTLAFALPIMERLAIQRQERGPKPRGEGPGCIVLAPTRELAKQVAREMTYLGEGLNLSVECFYGGMSYVPQENALRRGVDIVVGTPGRLIDHLEKGNLRLDKISFAVLDEADEMLSMGFSQDVETIFETLPPESERQVILFSATVPRWVKSLASQYQKKDVVTFDAVTTGTMASTTVRHCAVRVPERDEARAALLADIIAVHSQVKDEETAAAGPSRAIVFTQTKREADELATSGSLDGCGAAVLHGDVSQNQREVTLSQFRQGHFQVLVATDVAARGLDISGVDVVVQYRVPNDAESYIHRAGRTGRAGKSGTAVVMYSDRESRSLRNLERECRVKFVQESAPAPETALEAAVDMALGNVNGVEGRVIKHLLPRAEAMLSSGKDAAETLAAVLAIAGRRTRLEDRSVLSGEKGMRTVLIRGNREIAAGLAVRFISDLARTVEADTRIGLIRQCRDGSAVVDVPSEAADGLVAASESLGPDAELQLTIATGVPALKENERRQSGGRFGDRRGGYGDRRSGGGGRYGGRNEGGGNGRYGGRNESGGGRSRGSYRGDRSGGYSRDGYGSGRGRSDYSNGRSDYGGGRSGGYRRDGGGYRGRDGGGGRRNVDFLSDDF